jgi:hypothetical protein
MGFVTLRGEGLLAYVLPTPTGGTELVYLAGEPQDGSTLTCEHTNQVVNRALDVHVHATDSPSGTLDGGGEATGGRGVHH